MARILIRTKVVDIINFVESVKINGESFVIKVVEDWYGPLQWNKRRQVSIPTQSSESESEGVSIKNVATKWRICPPVKKTAVRWRRDRCRRCDDC